VIGQQLREATLTTPSGRTVHMRVLRPKYALQNVRELAATYQLWRRQAKAIEHSHPDAAFHAQFAAEVARIAAERLLDFSEQPRHLLVVGVDDSDAALAWANVLGINTAYWVPDEQVWYMAVGTTRPVDQPGYPNPDQVRGIGLELVGALVALMNQDVCAPVTLEPLDAGARRFWAARGFHDAGEEMRMTCPESRTLQATLAHSDHDDPQRGDAPFFTDRKAAARNVVRPG
jgi:hypothetical protein